MNDTTASRPAKPREVSFAVALMSLFNLATPLLENPATIGDAIAFSMKPVYQVLVVISFVVIWFFWSGHNWARWLVMATSVLALANLLAIRMFGQMGAALIVAEAALAIWLLFWLNTASAKSFFKPPKPLT